MCKYSSWMISIFFVSWGAPHLEHPGTSQMALPGVLQPPVYIDDFPSIQTFILTILQYINTWDCNEPRSERRTSIRKVLSSYIHSQLGDTTLRTSRNLQTWLSHRVCSHMYLRFSFRTIILRIFQCTKILDCKWTQLKSRTSIITITKIGSILQCK